MLREAIEAALVENPDDLASHMAYADVLIDQGDPRGEFIRVQLRLEELSLAKEERDALKQEEADLLARHQADWLGDLAPVLLENVGLYSSEYREHGPQFRFERGWLTSLTGLWLAVTGARRIAQSPTLRLLRELAIEYACGEGEGADWEPGDDVPEGIQFVGMFPLIRSPYLGNVRRLRLGSDPEVTGDSSYSFGHAAADLVALMPRLEECRLFTMNVNAARMFALPSLTHLKRLDYYHDRDYPLDILASNPALGCLERLDLFPHYFGGHWDRSYGDSYLDLNVVQHLFTSKHLKSLRHLALRSSGMGDEGVEELVRSDLLGRLKILNLSHGAITDAGARVLAGAAAARNLELLDLTDNALTLEGVAALTAAGIALCADNQHGEGDDRYLYVGEFE